MDRTPYITSDRLLNNSLGVDLSQLGQDNDWIVQPDIIVETASTLIDSVMSADFAYRQVTTERHRVVSLYKNWIGEPLFLPIRQISEMSIVTGWDTSGAPFTTDVPLGHIVIDNDRESFWTIYQLAFYAPPPAGIYMPNYATIQITYTSGYDDGTVQSDGLSVPAPFWLAQATLLTAVSIARQIIRNADDTSDATMINIGSVTIRRDPKHAGFLVPQDAINLVSKHGQSDVVIA